MVVSTQKSRPYTSTLRARQAEQTRGQILDAAVQLFADVGWAKTTLVGVADRAGVAVETVYKGWRSKKALLRAAMDVAIVGDAEPVPLLQRETFLRLHDEPPAQRLRGGVSLLGDLYSGPVQGVWGAMKEAAAGDPEVMAWCEEHELRRRSTLAEWLQVVYGRAADDTTLDSLWAQASIEVFTKLTVERKWSGEQWVAWFTTRVEEALGPT